jgi:hypothetical protein
VNQRIRELAEQADVFEYKTYYDPTFSKFVINDDKVEKLAELIVKECMACSTWVGRVNTTAIEPVHTAHAINQRITEHFGLTKT